MSGKRGVMNAILYKLLKKKKSYVYHGYVLLSFVFVRQSLRTVVSAECCSWDTILNAQILVF